MLKKFRYKDITWIDLESPTEAEVNELSTEYGIHQVVLAELSKPSSRARIDLFNDYIYLILHFPDHDSCQEVDFIISKDIIVTTHYEMINPLTDFAKIFETDFVLKKNQEKLHAGFIFYYIIKQLYSSIEDSLSLVNDQLKRVEEKVFTGQEREVVQKLSSINRELLDYRWSLKAHREVLASLELAGEDMFGSKFSYYLKAIRGEYERIWDSIESNRATFFDLRETNDSLLSLKANETMRVLTVAAFIFLPMTIVPQIFGMNTPRLPFDTQPNSFFLVLAIMVVTSSLFYLLARYKRWF